MVLLLLRNHSDAFRHRKCDVSYRWRHPATTPGTRLLLARSVAGPKVGDYSWPVTPANIRATTRRYRKVRHTQITLGHAIVRHLCYPSNISPQIVVKLAFSLRRHSFNGGFAISYPESDASIYFKNSARKLSEERWRLSNRNPPNMTRH